MRILFFSHYFPPESNAPANRTFEHCRLWVEAGHEVHVVTGLPSHPQGRLYPGYTLRRSRREVAAGVHVHRVWTHLAPNRGVLRRTLNYLSFVPTSVWRALRLGRFDVVLATSPQFFCAVAGWQAALLKRTPWVFELRDLWPESIAAVGAVRPGLVLRGIEKLELALYEHAARVVCVTRSFVRNLTRRGVDPTKLEYVPNGIEPDVWDAVHDGAEGRASIGARPEEITATYIGTVGMAHGIETLLDAAHHLRARWPTVRFAVVGDGAERARLEADASRRGLRNVTFTGQIQRAEVPAVLGATDISLVLLRDSPTFRTVLPSKMFEAMVAARPVVLGVDGEAREVLESSGGGVFVPPGDAVALAAAIDRLASDPAERARLGAAGREYVSTAFNRRAWASAYLEILEEVVRSRS